MTFNDFHFDLMRVWVISQDCIKLMESVLYTLQVPATAHAKRLISSSGKLLIKATKNPLHQQ